MNAERAELERLLAQHAARREESLAIAERELAEIAALLPRALSAGITKTEIHRITGVSRPTIDALLRRGDTRG